MKMNSLLTLPDYQAAYASGEATPVSAIAEVYRRISKHNDPAIFISLREIAEVQREAADLERRGPAGLPLYGIPVAIKDNIDVTGIPTTAACPDFAYTPKVDAAAVAKLRAAGALVIGKTNLDQFATGLVGVRSPYGVPRNTFDPEIVPGGSSSGSAVAVAAGIVPLALGTDTAGSGRVPAGLNNIVGLKPSLGAVSMTGVVPACRSLDCISIFALTVEDAYFALRIIAGFDEKDSLSRRIAAGPLSALPAMPRMGSPDAATLTFGGDKHAESAFSSALASIAKAGLTIPAVNMRPLLEAAALLYDGPWVAERYEAIREFIEAQPYALLVTTRKIIESATKFSAADAFAGFYKLADLRRQAEDIWRNIDVLVVPTFPRPRTLSDLEADPVGPNMELGTYTNFVNLLDMCALAVPTGLRNDGFPAGVTLIAPAGRDALLANLGILIQSNFSGSLGATSQPRPKAAILPFRATGDEIELIVVGAHLSGQPLNYELIDLGAHLIRQTRTSADYQLFALPGGPPSRPGLLRVAPGAGHAIEVESWALTPAAFGIFVAGIASPLGIGVVTLEDGSSKKGFVVEAYATENARDISSFGSWRAYVQSDAS